MLSIGIDIGGTFTDVVAADGRSVFATKVPSTPSDLVKGVEAGLEAILATAGERPSDVIRFMHGTTVATNALLEERGATIGLITTRGFEDVLEIGRQARPREALYRLDPRPQTPVFLAPRRRRIGVSERVDASGDVIEPLDLRAVERAAKRLVEEEAVTAIAICFLFSFLNPDHEEQARRTILEAYPELHVSISSEIDAVFREYERLCMTCTDAYIRPAVSTYLQRLEVVLAAAGVPAPPQVMQSRGAVAGVATALERPVMLVASGPAAGVQGALESAQRTGLEYLVTIDIGGTSSDIALVRGGRPLVTRGSIVRGFPLRMPMVDVASIGAGGGSIAWLDGGGGLRVGPRSAGAQPGPACYGRGGTDATVTDASLVLGYLNPRNFADGSLALDVAAAEAAVGRLAGSLGLGILETALGIHRIVNSSMAGQIHLMSVGRGHDVRQFGLVVLGGAGALHGCAVADELSIPLVVVPTRPGVLAAYGLLVSAIEHEQAVTFARRADEVDAEELERRLAALEREALLLIEKEDVNSADAVALRSADVRFVGQSYELEIELPALLDGAGLEAAVARFRDEHRLVYGHTSLQAPVEFVNLRAVARFELPKPPPPHPPRCGASTPRTQRLAYFPAEPGGVETLVFERSSLGTGSALRGPAIVEQPDSTTVIQPGWHATVNDSGDIVLAREKS